MMGLRSRVKVRKIKGKEQEKQKQQNTQKVINFINKLTFFIIHNPSSNLSNNHQTASNKMVQKQINFSSIMDPHLISPILQSILIIKTSIKKLHIFPQFHKFTDNLFKSFINRPKFEFLKGSFNDQLQLQDIYQHMYEQSQNNNQMMQVDMTSRETLLKRQKEMLQKINKKKQLNQEKQTIFYEKQLQKACNMKKYAIILCFGGSFSIALYDNFKCTTHKSDKKYVCRKKAGQRQLNKDKQSGSSIKSMGSQIRRDQQKKHVINVNQILNQHRDQLFKCQHIFLQAPGINRLYIINENQTMGLLQKKLRSICSTAKKANYTEIEVLNEVINQVHVVKIKGESQVK